MQLSKFSDFALRILIHLAAAPDQLLSTRQIAELHDAKYNHLTKVTVWLVQEGYAVSSRGRGGGLRLARDATEISLGEVLRKLERDRPLVECLGPDGGTCRLSPACGLLCVLQTAEESFFSVLDPISLADLPHYAPAMTRLVQSLNAQRKDVSH